MSLRKPSYVSATTGKAQSSPDDAGSGKRLRLSHSITASRTTPTLCVLVIMIGPSMNPASSTQVVPVISPLPLSAYHPPNTGASSLLRGRTAVTPVRTGPLPSSSLPSLAIRVAKPTATPATSVMALSGPGSPSNGMPRLRARAR